MFAEKTELNLMTADYNEGALVELTPAALDDVAGGIVIVIPFAVKIAAAALAGGAAGAAAGYFINR